MSKDTATYWNTLSEDSMNKWEDIEGELFGVFTFNSPCLVFY
jgi:hypothetical protein